MIVLDGHMSNIYQISIAGLRIEWKSYGDRLCDIRKHPIFIKPIDIVS